MSESFSTDVLVVGWGKAGKTLAGALGRSGRRVTLIERPAQMIGGTCINIACVPTKALVHQAAERRPEDDAQEWFRGAVGLRDDLIGRLNAANRAMLEQVDAVRLVVGGEASFTADWAARTSAVLREQAATLTAAARGGADPAADDRGRPGLRRG